ncbi:MAG TPA: hypothetical protein VIY48_12250 [Candidatus Paceibacterota bacterium]
MSKKILGGAIKTPIGRALRDTKEQKENQSLNESGTGPLVILLAGNE